ncbi:MAG: serine--tRNA ligase [Candidatus Nomurabacteria bacterium]|jgi:seryl-tRNA synthetase|nr:serine--tRNA ligase [Candidatus Nomurabacteria bacterium]
MLDINYVRENAEKVKEFSRNKGYKVDVDKTLALDEVRRELENRVNALREERNTLATAAKNARPSEENIARGKEIKAELAALETELTGVENEFIALLKQIPNAPTDDVPIGLTEDENVVAEVVGEPREFDFAPKNHWQIAEARGWIDKERATKVTGARFAYIKSDLVRLEFAIINYVISKLTDREFIAGLINADGLGKVGMKSDKSKTPDESKTSEKNMQISDKPFVPVLPPLMIKTEMYDAMDRLQPSDDRYKIEGEELWLQGSAEHVLGSMYAGEIIDEKDCPIRMLGFASSFRKEAGSYGKDMEGIFRMHQFDKLEMESFSTPETSLQEHYLFVAIQRALLEGLELPYRVIQKCTFDIGKPNARGIDMEVWLPGQGKYRETHTADYMTDYQTRRLKTRIRRADGTIELAHTNDATAFALGRIMIALIENGQTADNKVRLPKALAEIMGASEI